MNAAKLKKELIQDEGYRLHAYRDSRNFYTIGIGHLLGETPRMLDITDDECDALYEWDVKLAESIARSCLEQFDGIADARQRALVNMAFNRGYRLKTSEKILPAIQKAALSGDEAHWQDVPKAMAGSTWAKQVGDRAIKLGKMFATGLET